MAVPKFNLIMKVFKHESFTGKAIYPVLLLLLICVPLFVQNRYYLDVATMCGIYVVLALGLNVMVGYAGLLSFGYAAFFAIGAYTTGILMTQFHMSYWLTLPIAVLFSAVAGIVIGFPTLRMGSDYLAMITLGFGEIVRITATNLHITGGANGIFGVPAPYFGPWQLSQTWQLYYMALVMVVLAWLGSKRLESSRIGRAFACVRDDEHAAEAMGMDRLWIKLLAFIIGSVWAGLAGTFYVVKMTAVAPETFVFMTSCNILLGVVLGGIGNVPGVALGAVLVILLPEIFRWFASGRLLAFGIALIIMMLFRPQGILPAKEKTPVGISSVPEKACEGD